MQFVFDGTYHQAIRITGPKHNLLGLCLGNGQAVIITRLPPQAGQAERIDEQAVLAQVTAGLSEINHQLGTFYTLSAIRFLATDTPCTYSYKELTRKIIARLHNRQAFLEIPPPAQTT